MKEQNLIPLKEVASNIGLTEREARKILRNESHKDHHEYFWLFTKPEVKKVQNILLTHKNKFIPRG